jgi:nucleotide-binding universal stress UspA family protein
MRILVPVDDSDFSKAAIQAVLHRATSAAVEVEIMTVVSILSDLFPEISEHYGDLGLVNDSRFAAAKVLVNNAAEELRSKGIAVTTAVEWGDPRLKILERAKDWHADLIIVGSHGRSKFEHLLLGSVSEAVARLAHCSVEIVRIPKKS